MKKKTLILILVVLLLAATVVPALAGGSKRTDVTVAKNAKLVYALAGYVTAVDRDKLTVTIEVAVGNTLVEKKLGIDLASMKDDFVLLKSNLVEGELTRYLIAGGTVITFEKLCDLSEAAIKAGTPLTASSRGYLRLDKDGNPVDWAATRITLGASLTSK